MVELLNRLSSIEKVCLRKLNKKLKSIARRFGRTTSKSKIGPNTWNAFRKAKVKSKNVTKSMK
jgi:hypothetical protein